MSDTENMDIEEIHGEDENKGENKAENKSETKGENGDAWFPKEREEGDYSWYGEDSDMAERKYHANKKRLERNGGKIPEGNITLKFSDGDKKEIPRRYIELIKTYHEMLTDGAELNAEFSISELNVSNVSKETMDYILEYLNRYGDDLLEYELFLKLISPATEEEYEGKKIEQDLSNWDNDFFNKILEKSKYDLEKIANAANFLDIPTLLEKACKFYAKYIEEKDMSVEQLREFFELENDWTPEEYEDICKQHEWVEEPSKVSS